MSNLLYILLAILLLAILIVAHEWGHFIFARLCGIEVKEFSVGFGKRLCGWTSKKSGTMFSLRLVPLGGYCMFYEDETEESGDAGDKAYSRQPVWKRFISVLMGPGMNFLLAIVVLIAYLAFVGLPSVNDGKTLVIRY